MIPKIMQQICKYNLLFNGDSVKYPQTIMKYEYEPLDGYICMYVFGV